MLSCAAKNLKFSHLELYEENNVIYGIKVTGYKFIFYVMKVDINFISKLPMQYDVAEESLIPGLTVHKLTKDNDIHGFSFTNPEDLKIILNMLSIIFSSA